MKIKDIAWLGGLLEGEGWFGLTHRDKYPTISLKMTDEDTVKRAAAIWGSKAFPYKTSWITQIAGYRAIQWMFMLYTFLGKRRREKVAKVVQYWKVRHTRAPNGTRPTCHPDRKLHAFEMCRPCYQKQYKKKQKLLKLVV